jgi:superfamily II DNA or RNA helicase
MTALITDAEITEAVGPKAFREGQNYFRMYSSMRQVRSQVAADGRTLISSVRIYNEAPIRQTVQISRMPDGGLSAKGICSCPRGRNCEHVAAVLFDYQLQGYHLPGLDAPRADLAGASPGGTGTLVADDVETLLPFEIDDWLRILDAAQEEESEDYPPSIRRRLLYVLHYAGICRGLGIQTHSIDLTPDGAWAGPAREHDWFQLSVPGQQPKFLRPSDRAILRQLTSHDIERREEYITNLQSIIATGRARWGAWDGPVVTVAKPVAADLVWVTGDDGGQRPTLNLAAPLVPINIVAPWYANPQTGEMGPVKTSLPPRVLTALLRSPSLSPEMADRVREEMARRWPQRNLPMPSALAVTERLEKKLRPQLLLHGAQVPSASGSQIVPQVRLSWVYGPITIGSATKDEGETVVHRDGTLFRVIRDLPAEQAADARLHATGLRRVTGHGLDPEASAKTEMWTATRGLATWHQLLLRDLRTLRAEGWQVTIDDTFPLRLVEPDDGLRFDLREGSGIDWFDFDIGVMVQGEHVSLVAALEALLTQSTPNFALLPSPGADNKELLVLLKLADGREVAVPDRLLRPIIEPLIELLTSAGRDKSRPGLRLSHHNAADLALLEALSAAVGARWSGGEAIRALGRQLRAHHGIPHCPSPDGFEAALRGYQKDGLAWLQFLRAAGLGGVLADDMGLGKTVQALAHFAVEQAEGRLDRPVLVICPTSLVSNWKSEASRFAPRLRTLVLHGPNRAADFGALAEHDLVITTYPLLARDHAVLAAQQWHIVVLDEAQMIKNPMATTSRLARTLRARQRLCLSGTPLENHLGELWSLFDFLMPGLLGDRRQFGWRYRGPIEKDGDVERQAQLARRVAPFLLRRTKAQVASDLPPKTEITEAIELGDGQRAIYESVRLAMHANVLAAIAQRGLAASGIVILDALLKLRQACCDPRLLKLATPQAAKAKSAKLERLMELLPQLLAEGRSVLLFSQFTAMLALIEAELKTLAVPYVVLTGDTRNRETPINRFQSGEVKLFLISLKAGGVGLNLTAADTVIHYDPWWNPAVEEQATGRAHRIGQDKPVFVHRLTTVGTVEEKMAELKERKQALVAGMLGDPIAAASAMTESDLAILFSP